MGRCSPSLRSHTVLSKVNPGIRRRNARYCLSCFSAMPASHGACSSCGYRNFPSDRRVYWNRNARIRALENLGKIVATMLGLGLMFWAPMTDGANFVSAGWCYAMFLVAIYVTCMTLGKLTRHLPAFDPRLIWTLSFGLAALLGLPWSLFGRSVGITLATLLLIATPTLITSAFRRWKDSLRGQTLLTAE